MNQRRSGNQNRSRDLGTSSDRAMYSPSEERGRGASSERNQERDQSPSTEQSSSRDDQDYKDQQQRRDESEQQYSGGNASEARGMRNQERNRGARDVADRGKTRDKEV